MRDSRLPVTADPYPDERLTQWITRVASLNRMTPKRLLGPSRFVSALDEHVSSRDVARLTELTGLTAKQISAMTVSGRFSVSRHATRKLDRLACTHCQHPVGLSALFGLMPLCVNCHHLLTDDSGYVEATVDPELVQLQQKVEQASRRYGCRDIESRVWRLASVVRHNWPTPPAHEPPERLSHALDQIAHGRSAMRPATAAVLLARALDDDMYRAATAHWERYLTGWYAPREHLDPAPLGSIADETDRLHSTIRRLGIEPGHIPLAMTFGGEGPLLGDWLRRQRESWAATLRREAEKATGVPTTLRKLARVDDAWPMDDPWTIRLLTDGATALHRDGLIDRERAHYVFWELWTVPPRVFRQLPRLIQTSRGGRWHAALWVWLTMTGAGRIPDFDSDWWFPNNHMERFDRDLTLEGRMILLEYAMYELDGWVDEMRPVFAPTRVAIPDSGHPENVV